MILPEDATLEAVDDDGREWVFAARDDLADGADLCPMPRRKDTPPVVLIALDREECVGIALSAEAARELGARLITCAADALRDAPSPDPTAN